MPNIIALAGRRKSGKSTVADLMVEIGKDQGIEIKRRSFAHPLKLEYSRRFGVPLEDLYDEYQKESHREKLMIFAAHVNKLYPRIFIDYLFDRLKEDDNIIIDDMRTMEQLQELIAQGGKPYKVHADSQKRFTRGAWPNPTVDDSLQESELGDLSSWTFHCLGGGVIYNNYTSEEILKKELIWLTREIFGKVSQKSSTS